MNIMILLLLSKLFDLPESNQLLELIGNGVSILVGILHHQGIPILDTE